MNTMEQQPDILNRQTQWKNSSSGKSYVRQSFGHCLLQNSFLVCPVAVDMNDLEGRTARRALSGKQIGAIDEEVDHFVRFVVVEENHRALTALASQQLRILL